MTPQEAALVLERDTLECPCCGDIGATANARNLFVDGQRLECGCAGHVSLDSETPPYIMVGDAFCPTTAKCGGNHG